MLIARTCYRNKKGDFLQSWCCHHLLRLFLESGRFMEEVDVSSNLTNKKVTGLVKFMKNRKRIFRYCALLRMSLVCSVAWQKKYQQDRQCHPDEKKIVFRCRSPSSLLHHYLAFIGFLTAFLAGQLTQLLNWGKAWHLYISTATFTVKNSFVSYSFSLLVLFKIYSVSDHTSG